MRAVCFFAACIYLATASLALFILCDVARVWDGSRATIAAAVALAFVSTAAACWVLFLRGGSRG